MDQGFPRQKESSREKPVIVRSYHYSISESSIPVVTVGESVESLLKKWEDIWNIRGPDFWPLSDFHRFQHVGQGTANPRYFP